MIRIAISQAAFDAIARTMPFGSVNFETGVDDKGSRARLSIACARHAGQVRASATSFCGWPQSGESR